MGSITHKTQRNVLLIDPRLGCSGNSCTIYCVGFDSILLESEFRTLVGCVRNIIRNLTINVKRYGARTTTLSVGELEMDHSDRKS